jgi:hypothetical protein
MVDHYGQALSCNNINLTSLFTTDQLHAYDGADFLVAGLGIFNKTIADIFASHTSSFKNSLIQARSTIKGKFQGHGNIEDSLSSL